MATLDDRLDQVVGSKAAGHLDEAFGIRTVGDLLRHYPRGSTDGMSLRDADVDEPPQKGEHVTLVDTVTRVESKWSKKTRKEFLVVTLGDRRPVVTATFFNPRVIKKGLVKDSRVMLSGEVGFYRGNFQLTHPDFLILESPTGKRNVGSRSLRSIADGAQTSDGALDLSGFERQSFPIYPASTRIQSWDIFACVRQVLDVLDPIADPLPSSILRQRHLMGEDEALRTIHLAETDAERLRARERLTFDEAVGLQWALLQRRQGTQGQSGQSGPSVVRRDDGLVAGLIGRLPFELTDGQREILEVLSAEIAGTRPMNRLLQGEVGSGKTVVALLAMLQAIDAGYQCALLAPTEVLATQHARSINDILGPLAMRGQLGGDDGGTRVALLTGSLSQAQKRQVRDEVSSGQAGIVIGTHALLEDAVEFHRLGMVVIDEQHRFGVEQRDRLRGKAPAGLTPHLLVMTATPIPRTVALTVYGDLETSTLRELPRGRQPIATNAIFVSDKPAWLDRAWARIAEEVDAGRQAYVVAPRIDETDPSGNQNGSGARISSATVVDLYAFLQSGPLAALRLGLMHGRLPADEKDAVMEGFRNGDIDVLVCTTVVEVGVDVPNATVMLVIDSDWFGISQLHQLRGRIGRGEHPSLCLLATKVQPDSKSGKRLRAVAATLDGFALADMDLDERREGDVLGDKQSGRAITLKLLSLAQHREVIEAARDFCESAHQQNPADRGLAMLAAPFVDTDRVDYLDKA